MRVLTCRRQTISEAKASVDGLHALIEQCFPKISSRVLPLEAPDFQNSGDADRMLDHDTDSLATIQAQSLNPSDESAITSKPVQFDFSDDLQNSRVYRRNQAFRTSVISALTRSAYSLGCSFFSDLSMAEVSNISVINLLITEGEIFNPTRSSQTWSTQTNEEALGDRNNRSYGDRKSFQLNDIILEPIPRDDSSTAQGLLPTSTLTRQRSVSLLCAPFTTLSPPKSPSYSDGDSFYSLEDLPEGRTRARDANILDSTSSLPLVDPLDPPSPSKTQAASLPASHGLVEKDIEYPCKGCGEVCFMPSCWLPAKPPPMLGRSANECTPLRYLKRERPLSLVCLQCSIITLRERYTDKLSAGNRWHMDCFRCNTCGNVVDSNTDLLLISDGLFVCNDCRYSCSVCNSKIEDMAILTEDEAFCAPCFKCLRCKKKIESLKYGQTSLGFFCVDCFKCRYCKKMENLYRFRRSQEIIIICRECRESRLQTRLRKALPENDQSEETISNTLTNAQHLVDMESPKLPLPGRPILTDPLGRAPLGRAITLASAPTAPAECAWNFF